VPDRRYSQWPTFPQVYIEGEFFGGCDIVLGGRWRRPVLCLAVGAVPQLQGAPDLPLLSGCPRCAACVPARPADAYQSGELKEALERAMMA
jgi:hypothetical protein